MNSTTTTDSETTQAETPAAKKERRPPRKLSMTDKIREARQINVNKVARLEQKAEQLRAELALTVKELNEARQEIARADAVLPPPSEEGSQLEAERFANGAHAE